MVLGQLVGFPEVCGPNHDLPLDAVAARAAVQALDPQQAVEEVASAALDVAAEQMAAAMLAHGERQGVDPAAAALVAFGGAGGAYACSVAEGMSSVVVPALAGVFRHGRGTCRASQHQGVQLGAADWTESAKQMILELPSGELQLELLLQHRGTSSPIAIEVTLAELE